MARKREIVMRLVTSAKVKIPEFPKETWDIEHYYISELYEKGGKQYIFAFKCNPALKKDDVKKMTVSCVVCSPSKGLEAELPLMREDSDTVISTIDTEEVVNECLRKFEHLLQRAEDF